jgi:hypothetical protein
MEQSRVAAKHTASTARLTQPNPTHPNLHKKDNLNRLHWAPLGSKGVGASHRGGFAGSRPPINHWKPVEQCWQPVHQYCNMRTHQHMCVTIGSGVHTAIVSGTFCPHSLRHKSGGKHIIPIITVCAVTPHQKSMTALSVVTPSHRHLDHNHSDTTTP